MKDDKVYLHHILDAAEKIEEYVSTGNDDFMNKTYLQDAVVRQLEIIGEATKRVSDEFRLKHTKIPWRRMAGLRDVLIHDYMGVDIDAVWQVTQRDIPELKKYIRKIL